MRVSPNALLSVCLDVNKPVIRRSGLEIMMDSHHGETSIFRKREMSIDQKAFT